MNLLTGSCFPCEGGRHGPAGCIAFISLVLAFLEFIRSRFESYLYAQIGSLTQSLFLRGASEQQHRNQQNVEVSHG